MRYGKHGLVKDESGITMVLAIMTIVIVGVMGAGLLTFVVRDLDTLVETNRGHTASEVADAGLEAAKRQLSRVDARPSQYDGISMSTNTESDWSDDGSPKTLSFDGNNITVGIRYLRPASSASETAQADRAPEVLPVGATDGADDGTDPDYPRDRSYFRITVEGNAGGNGETLRRFAAIYRTEKFELPAGYFATRDINIGDTATKVNGVSLFAERYITNVDPAKRVGGRVRCGTVCGKDQAYGNWAFYPDSTPDPNDGRPNPYNRTARGTDDAGAAALGVTGSAVCPLSSQSGITYASNESSAQKSRTANPQHYGVRDYDRDSDQKCTASSLGSSGQAGFSADTWGGTANQLSLSPPQVTFPFPSRNDANDNLLLEELRTKAQDQGHYVRVDNGTSSSTVEIDDGVDVNTPAGAVYPDASDLETVMFIEFTGTSKGDVDYKAGGNGDLFKGTIVVVNADLKTSSSAADFQGIMIVRDGVSTGSATIESQVTKFDNGGSLDIDGYANVEGDIVLKGSVGGTLPGDLTNGVPGLVSVSQWSLRECFDEGCG